MILLAGVTAIVYLRRGRMTKASYPKGPTDETFADLTGMVTSCDPSNGRKEALPPASAPHAPTSVPSTWSPIESEQVFMDGIGYMTPRAAKALGPRQPNNNAMERARAHNGGGVHPVDKKTSVHFVYLGV
mgnify:FL=1